MDAKKLVNAVKSGLKTNNETTKSGSAILSQKDVAKVIQARVDNIMKAIEDIAIKAANTSSVNTAVQDIETSLTNFAKTMEGANFKGMWFKFFKFKMNVKKLVRMTNSLEKITKDAEPGVKALASVAFISQSLSEICDKVKNIKIPVFTVLKTKRIANLVSGLRTIIEGVTEMDKLLKMSKGDFKMLKQVVHDIKDVIDTIKDIHVGIFFKLKMRRLLSALDSVQRVIRKVANMRRVGKALRKIRRIKMFFNNLALMFIAISLLIPVFVVAPIAMLLIAMCMWVFRLIMKLITRLVRKIAWETVESTLYMVIIVLSLVAMTVMLLMMASLAKQVVSEALWILGLLALIIVTMFTLKILAKIASKMASVVAQGVIGIGSFLGLLGMIFAMTIMLLIMSTSAKTIVENAGWLLGSFGIMTAVIGLAIALSFLGYGAMFALAGMGLNLALISMLFLIAVQLNAIQNFKLDRKKINQTVKTVQKTVTDVQEMFEGFSVGLVDSIVLTWSLRRINRVVNQIRRIVKNLNMIQEFELNRNAIKKNIKQAFDTCKEIETFINEQEKLPDDFSIGDLWSNMKKEMAKNLQAKAAAGRLKRTEMILGKVIKISECINEIQNIKIDEKTALSNLQMMFRFVDEIETFINESEKLPDDFSISDLWSNWKKNVAENLQAKAAEGRLRRSEAILSKVKSIAECLNEIQKVTFKEDDVKDKLQMLFNFVKFVEEYIQEQDKLPDGWNQKDFTSYFMKNLNEQIQAKAAEGRLGRSEAILLKLKTMTDALKTIQELKIDPNKTMEKVKQLFAVSDDLLNMVMNGETIGSKEAELINNLMGSTSSGNIQTVLDEANKLNTYRKNLETNIENTSDRMGKVESVLSLVSGMAAKLTEITKIKINSETVKNKVTSVFTTVDEIVTLLSTGTYTDLNTDEFEKKFGTVLDVVEDLNLTMTDLAKVDGSQINGQKKMLDNYVKFIDKVNTMDVEKVKTTADLFGKMAKFSESIGGDFEKLADTINEKLMPVIEELKAVMTEIPEKLEVGFANTSASIGANQSSVSPDDIRAQIMRETPDIEERSVLKEIAKRLKEKQQDKMNGTAAKLDELIGLLKGYSGQPVIVKTV